MSADLELICAICPARRETTTTLMANVLDCSAAWSDAQDLLAKRESQPSIPVGGGELFRRLLGPAQHLVRPVWFVVVAPFGASQSPAGRRKPQAKERGFALGGATGCHGNGLIRSWLDQASASAPAGLRQLALNLETAGADLRSCALFGQPKPLPPWSES